MKDHFTQLLQYNHWANSCIFHSVANFRDPKPAANRLLGHILAAQQIWYARLRGEGTSVAVWPELSLKAIKTWMNLQHSDWEAYLTSLQDKDLEQDVTYTTTTGEVYQNSRSEIITHVLHHGTHHRAQISAIIRATGDTPPTIDYIVFLRNLQKAP